MAWRDQVFLSWAGLRGAVPVVLATVPVTVGAPNVEWIFELVFVLVVIFTIVQAPTLPWVAQRLGVDATHHRVDLAVEATPLRSWGPRCSRSTSGRVRGCRGARCSSCACRWGPTSRSSCARGGLRAGENDVLRRGDQLLVVTPSAVRARAERRLHAVSRTVASPVADGWPLHASADPQLGTSDGG